MIEEELKEYLHSRNLAPDVCAVVLNALSPEAIQKLYTEAKTPISEAEAKKIASVRRTKLVRVLETLDEAEVERGALPSVWELLSKPED